MAFNKSKELNNIQKLIQAGKIDKAIKKLEGVLDVDPNDASLSLKIGELYLKKGRKTEAKEAYFKAANTYLKDGYNNRAIATYKMISRADPDDLEVCLNIAELFEKQGLVGDALQQYKYAATIFDQRGQKTEMADILKKILEIDPDNTPARIKIAEVHFINNEDDEAYTILTEVSKDLKHKKLYSDCIKAFEFFLTSRPKDKFLLKEIAHLHILQGNADEGLKRIQAAQKLDPEDTTTLLILAETYLMIDKINDAESIYCDLLRKDDKNYKAKFGLSKIFLSKDNIAEAVNSIDPFYSNFEEDGGLQELADFYEAAIEKDSQNITALEKLGDIYRYKNNTEKLIKSYVKLADVYDSTDQSEKAAFLCQKIVQVDPTNEKAKAILSKVSGDLSISDLTSEAEGLDDETISEHITEANVYLKYGLYDQSQEHIDAILTSMPNHLEALIAQKDIFVAKGEKDVAITELFKLADLSSDRREEFINEVLKIDPDNSKASEMLGAPAAPAEPAPEEVKPAAAEEVETFEGIDLVIEEPEELKSPEKKAAAPKGAKKSVQEELEEAEFYFMEGLFEDAKSIYRRVLLDDPYNMTAVEKLEQIEKKTGETAPAAKIDSAATGGPDELFDFAKELEASLPDDLLSPPGMGGEQSAPMDDRNSTDDIFTKFKKGIDEHIDSKDYESHYNLGIAYKEMGLLSDSIDEFKKALKADSSKVFECCAMLGMVSLETSKFEEAIFFFEKIFAEVKVPDEQISDLRYELAVAYSENGQFDKALKNFNIIHKIDSTFRDIKEKIKIATTSDKRMKEGKKPEKRAKISYV